MRDHGQFLFIGILVFVFPLIFIYTTQSFLETAYSNIQTAEKQRVGMLQDTITSLLQYDAQPDLSLIAALSRNVKTENPDVSEF